ncbi:MAG: hypothetical protein JWO36_5617 [Myxococcales bacterium]|nr:hypothetical protein [Myxococcales bacterium]
MVEQTTPVELAERVAKIALGLNIETALRGAYALAAYHYVRASSDIDLATVVQLHQLENLKSAVEDAGFHTSLRTPDDQDPLGGVLTVWERSDDEGDPIDPVEVVNYLNPYRPQRTPALQAIRNAISLDEKPALRYPRLSDLIALKLYAGNRGDVADVVELLVRNPNADLDEIRSTCKGFGFDQIDELIQEAQDEARRP